MTKENFNKLREELFLECEKITKTKGDDYTKGNIDVLSNFKEGSFLGLTPYQTIGVYMKKHTDAIFNYIKNEGECESEPIQGRILDAINYLVFLQAIIEERKDGK